MIHPYLNLTLGHIQKSTFDYLQFMGNIPVERPKRLHEAEWPDFIVAPYDTGVFVGVPPIDSEGYDKIAPDLRVVFTVANKTNIGMIQFDSTGSQWPHLNLPVYDWC